MSEAKHTAGKLFLQVDSDWPWPMEVLNECGEEFLRVDRYARASGQKSLQDCLDAVGFKYEDRQEVSEKMYRQQADMERLVAAWNSCEDLSTEALESGVVVDLLHELRHLVRLLEPLERDGTMNVPGLATLNGAREAIKKAEGNK